MYQIKSKEKKPYQRFLSVLLLLFCMIAASIILAFSTGGAVSADNSGFWDGEIADWHSSTQAFRTAGIGSAGSATNPWLIDSPAQFALLSDIINSGNYPTLNTNTVYYELTADLVLNDLSFVTIWSDGFAPQNKWTPIGISGTLNPFRANFNGGGFVIRGVYVSSSDNHQGLFGYVLGGTISNLGVKQSFIRGNYWTGGIVGMLDGGIIANSFNAATISAYSQSGGVAGYIISYSTVLNSFNTGAVTTRGGYTGGIVGGLNTNSRVLNSFNSGVVSANGNRVGGVAGIIRMNAAIYNSFNAGSVVNLATTDTMGGIVGSVGYEDDINVVGTLRNSYFLKTPTINRDLYNIGNSYYGSTVLGTNVFNAVGALDGGGTLLTALNDWIAAPTQTAPSGFGFKNWQARSGTLNHLFPAFTNDDSTAVVPKVWDGTIMGMVDFSGGAGTAESPFLIANAGQLYLLARYQADNTPQRHYRLVADITLNYIGDWFNWAATPPDQTWTSIGTAAYPFRSSFDGGGFTIRGLYSHTASADLAGLFGLIDGGRIINLNIEKSFVSSTQGSVGTVAGRVESGTISTVSNSGRVVGSGTGSGGIVGVINNGVVINAYNLGAVSGMANVGGVVGIMDNSKVANVYNAGQISGTASTNIGGIAGQISNASLVTNAFNMGAITGSNQIGGVVGHINDGSIKNVYNAGIITGTTNTGSIVGSFGLGDIFVANAYYLTTPPFGSDNIDGIDIISFNATGILDSIVAIRYSFGQALGDVLYEGNVLVLALSYRAYDLSIAGGERFFNFEETDLGAGYIAFRFVTAQRTAAPFIIIYQSNVPANATYGVVGVMLDSIFDYGDRLGHLRTNSFRIPGWQFVGWSTNPDGTGQIYEDAESVANLTVSEGANLVLYAVWAENRYVITFNVNLPLEVPFFGFMLEATFLFETPRALPLNGFGSPGRIFIEWNTEADGSGTSFSNGEVIFRLTTENNGVIEFFAIWELRTYRVIFNDWDGTNLYDTEVPHGTSISSLMPPDPTRPEWSFVRWEGYVDGMVVTGNHTFIAVYVNNPTLFLVTFMDADGAIFKSVQALAGTLIASLTPEIPPTHPLGDDFVFVRWGGLESWAVVTGNHTFYPAFEFMPHNFEVTFFDYNGRVIWHHPAIHVGTLVSELFPVSPSRLGFVFTGWSGFVSGMMVTGDISFIALYEIIPPVFYTIEFLNYEGTQIFIKTDAVFGMPLAGFTPAVPYRDGYVFVRWDGGYDPFGVVLGDRIFTAVFAEITVPRFTVIFFDYDGNIIKSIDNVAEGSLVAMLRPAINPIRVGFTFIGWEGLTDGLTVTEDMNFYALYIRESERFSIRFYVDDLLFSEISGIVFGAQIIIMLPNAYKEGYLFIGWSIDGIDWPITERAGRLHFTMPAGNIIFTAIFEEVPSETYRPFVWVPWALGGAFGSIPFVLFAYIKLFKKSNKTTEK